MINQNLYEKCRENDWSKDLVGQFPTYEAYQEHGLGAVILKEDELVA